MIPNSAKLVYFSPTRTTKTVVEYIARGLEIDSLINVDLTSPAADTSLLDARHDELLIIGAPVYGGRLPRVAEERLRKLQGNNTPAVVVVVYGNRGYDDALLELKDLAVDSNMSPVAAGAFIGEHSFSNENTPIAPGRPDTQDLAKALSFGAMIRRKLAADSTVGDLQIPGNHPYKERGPAANMAPVSDNALCTHCEQCVTVCPTGAITGDDGMTTDASRCILCFACVKHCPSGARAFQDPRAQQIADRLYANCSQRQEPAQFL